MTLKKNLKYVLISTMMALSACTDDYPFAESDTSLEPPSNLRFSEFVGVMEHSAFRSDRPTVQTNGYIPSFKLVKITKDGADVSQLIPEVKILQAIEETYRFGEGKVDANGDSTYVAIDSSNNGVIVLEDGNSFSLGEYKFTIAATIANDAGETKETVFNDALTLRFEARRISNACYLPYKYNFVIGSTDATKAPLILKGTPDVSYSLQSHTDILSIDKETGIISLNPAYAGADANIKPIVAVSYANGSTENLMSNHPLEINVSSVASPVKQPKEFYITYPTFAARTGMSGYNYAIIDQGKIYEKDIWRSISVSPLSSQKAERPKAIADAVKSVRTDLRFTDIAGSDSKNWGSNHHSWLTIDEVDLSLFDESQFASLKLCFYIRANEVEYDAQGAAPALISPMISTDEKLDVRNGNWTDISAKLTCEINQSGEIITGLPYPGDNSGAAVPDANKDPNNNNLNKWIRCELDLSDYRKETNFRLGFQLKTKAASAYKITKETGNPGLFIVSDVSIKGIVDNK